MKIVPDDETSDHSDNNEFECAYGTVTARLLCILSYNGSTFDSALNYLLIVVNFVYCVVTMKVAASHRGRQRRKLGIYHAIGAIVFVVTFQLLLCLGLGCSGVSIIWCSMCGWIISERRHLGDMEHGMVPYDENFEPTDEERSVGKIQTSCVILLDMMVICYYAVALPAISTVAHICALVLGAILSMMPLMLLQRTAINNGLSVITADSDRGRSEGRLITSQSASYTQALLDPRNTGGGGVDAPVTHDYTE
jgi:hypothetical protein